MLKSTKKRSPSANQKVDGLVLASQSAARRRLLRRLGLPFLVCPANIDEAAVARKIKDPENLVRTLSRLKAASVRLIFPNAVVIGSDQVLVCQGRIFGKPKTSRGARAQLKFCSGQTITLFTGVCVTRFRHEKTWVHLTKMKLRELSQQEIAAYVDYDQPLECSGSFKFESRGISLFDEIRTNDPTAIEGLPLLSLARVLRSFAFRSRR